MRSLRAQPLMIVAALTALAVVHTTTVWRRYSVGSFDDDASYLLVAKALAAGHGLTARLLPGVPLGVPLAGTYPPGYSALLAPLTFVAGDSDVPFRLLSTACLVAVLPMTWVLMRRRSLNLPQSAAVLGLLGLNPVLATYSSMVMAELPFLVALMGLILLADRWDRSGARLDGLWVVLAAASLVYLKQAGLGVVGGLVLWLLLRRERTRAVVAGAVSALLLSPVVLARLLTSTPLVGARYSLDLSSSSPGGIGDRPHTALTALGEWPRVALSSGLVPWHWVGSPFTKPGALDATGPVALVIQCVRWSVPAAVVVGAVVWAGRHRTKPEPFFVGVYFLQTLAFPFINERRSILLLPIFIAFGVVGASWLTSQLHRLLHSKRLATTPLVLVASGLTVLLLSQFTRDYLYAAGASSSRPKGADYNAILADAGSSTDIVETNFVWTTALYTGKRTSSNASSYNPALSTRSSAACEARILQASVFDDVAGFILAANLGNSEHEADCVRSTLDAAPWAVHLLSSAVDAADVYELIGPGTAHPNLIDLADSVTPAGLNATDHPISMPTVTSTDSEQDSRSGRGYSTAGIDSAALTYRWSTPTAVVQLSLGSVDAPAGSRVSLQLLDRQGEWTTVESTRETPQAGCLGYQLVPLPARISWGARVFASGAQGQHLHLRVRDFHALGMP